MNDKGWLQLATGRKVCLTELYQRQTYAGVFMGNPRPDLNRRIIKEVLTLAEKKLSTSTRPLLIALPNRAIESSPARHDAGVSDDKEANEAMAPAYLPRIVCMANLESYEPARNPEDHASFLTIVWFQDQWAMPIEQGVEDEIRRVDWNNCAFDFCW